MESNVSVTISPPELGTTVRLSVMAEELRPVLKHLLKLLKAAKPYSSYAELVNVELEDAHLLFSATDGFRAFTLGCRTVLAENLPARVSLYAVREWLDSMPMKGPTTLTAEPDDRTFPNLAQIDPGMGSGSWLDRKYLIEALQALDGVEGVQIDTNGLKPTRLTPINLQDGSVEKGFILIQPILNNNRKQQAEHDD